MRVHTKQRQIADINTRVEYCGGEKPDNYDSPRTNIQPWKIRV